MRKFYLSVLVLVVIITCIYTPAKAQMPFDEVMMGKGEFCLAMLYERGTWDKYWEGTYLRENANIGTFTRQMAMPMVAVGLLNRVNLIASLPYISTTPSAGTQVGQKGFQDLNVSIKVNWLERKLGKGALKLLTNTSFSTPMGNYLGDYMPFSIGSGAPELGMRGIAAYRFESGLVLRTALAYLWRGQSEIERNYYYQDGSVYSNFMKVPNAINFHAAVGYWLMQDQLRLEATYQSLNCLTGDDIRTYNSPQPTNKTEINQVGAWAQYYINGRQGLGAIAYYNYTIAGRNMGQFSTVGVGLTYQFKAFNK